MLTGDCVISLCMAFYAYLREECGVNLSWCGNREIAVPEELPVPAVERRYAVPQRLFTRLYELLHVLRLFGRLCGIGRVEGQRNRFYGDERRQHAALHHRHAGRVV
ncbi:MAG: alpha-N-acetylglucosaminidase N-terminal domain-containing protein [Acutalibacteraceae bacterium]